MSARLARQLDAAIVTHGMRPQFTSAWLRISRGHSRAQEYRCKSWTNITSDSFSSFKDGIPILRRYFITVRVRIDVHSHFRISSYIFLYLMNVDDKRLHLETLRF